MPPTFTFLLLFAALSAFSYAVPLHNDDADRIWNIAENWANGQHKEQLRRHRRGIKEYGNSGSLGALLEFGDDDGFKIEISCSACKAAGESVKFLLGLGHSEEDMLGFLYDICIDFKLMTENVCSGFTKNVGPEIVVVLNTTTLSSLQICSYLVGDACGKVDNPSNNWKVPLPPVTKPPVQAPQLPPEGTDTLKVLHISDTHIDLKYAAGTPSVCNEPLCCRTASTARDGAEPSPAGKWGDWKCDTPMATFDNWIEHVSQQHKDLDYIVWTGDLPSHDLWDQTQQSTLDILRVTASKLKTAFPDIPIYPSLGNHDSAPVNSFPQPEVGGKWNISWLYDELVDIWDATHLTNNEATQTIRKGAFYSTLAKPGLRIISLNMNYCYLNNWWLIVNSTDPAQELAWLTEELQKAEYAGEKVHILGHIPPGHTDCLNTWSKIYAQLITRYEGTVMAQFFGHTHKDEFEVYYDVEDTKRPVAVSYIGPSITTYTDLNPGYRIYHVDAKRQQHTGLVLDHETWFFDLDEANKDGGKPNWQKSYTMKEEYGMTSLLPSDWNALYEKLASDNATLKLYYKHYTKESPQRGSCDNDCKKGRLCGIRSCMLYGEPDQL